jgi:hypothetical protein
MRECKFAQYTSLHSLLNMRVVLFFVPTFLCSHLFPAALLFGGIFDGTKADPDVWIRAAVKPNGFEYYEIFWSSRLIPS